MIHIQKSKDTLHLFRIYAGSRSLVAIGEIALPLDYASYHFTKGLDGESLEVKNMDGDLLFCLGGSDMGVLLKSDYETDDYASWTIRPLKVFDLHTGKEVE